MEDQMTKFARIGEAMTLYGREVVVALAILVVGLIILGIVIKLTRRFLQRFTTNLHLISTISSIIYVLLLLFVVVTALEHAGMNAVIIRRTLLAISLAAVGLFIILRPYIPTLPFKVGNTIEAGGLLGRVEAITLLNTRLRSFDGKTVFVPNSKILNDIVVNYHFTPTRQIRLVFGIGYRDDLLKAKKVITETLAEDPRVLDSPAARVFVLNLSESSVELAVRPWVKNTDYWVTRCDLLEKIKLRFDQEGITIAFPQRDIHVYLDPAGIDSWISETSRQRE